MIYDELEKPSCQLQYGLSWVEGKAESEEEGGVERSPTWDIMALSGVLNSNVSNSTVPLYLLFLLFLPFPRR
jgi:hypothetical protein